ncbi:MAG: ATP-binding protein, partial [Nitrososphaera sp.]|nr:ATP-binding protein [Nitrososphaera sp.]
RVRTEETPWLENKEIELNAGLVAIIGPRGSGKTALVDVLAAGSNAINAALGESSFLKRASSPVDYLGDATVELAWGDGSKTNGELRQSNENDAVKLGAEDICYLSQHFVERLCSSAGLATELRQEMERVIFNATDPTEKLETESFDELANVLLEPIRHRRSKLIDAIQTKTEEIVREDELRDRLPNMRQERDALKKKLENDRKNLQSLLPKGKGKDDRARRLMEFEAACVSVEAKVENLRRRRKLLEDLANDVAHIRTYTEPARLTEMRRRFAGAGISDSDWKAFGMTFVGNVDSILNREKGIVDKAIIVSNEGDPSSPFDTNKVPLVHWPLKQLKAERDVLKKEVGIDAQQQKKYDELQGAIAQQETSLVRLDAVIKNAEGAVERRRQLIDSRRTAYVEVFDTFVEEENVLRRLYAPLQQQLMKSTGALAKLDFVVRRSVDLDAWASNGETLLDLRNATSFRGHGALQNKAEQFLLSAWTQGNAEEVAMVMDRFRTTFQDDLLNAKPASIRHEERQSWIQKIASWLYDVSHIRIEYGIEYERVPIEQLSPGTRGIVLLLL